MVSIRSANATRVAGYLAGAQKLGALSAMMGLLGGQVDSMSMTGLSDQVRPEDGWRAALLAWQAGRQAGGELLLLGGIGSVQGGRKESCIS